MGVFISRMRGWALPLLIYSLAACFMTWPLITQLSSHIGGAGYGDSLEYTRLGWWAGYALQHGLNPFYQSLMGYPDGFFSAVQWSQPLIYWPIALLGLVVGPIAGFNLWLLLEIILSGLTAYWLCLEVLGKDAVLPALIGGLIFMAFPTVQGHLSAGHINPLANYAFPVVVGCLYRLIDNRGSLKTALLGAAALWILALGNFTFPVFLLLPVILFGGIYVLIFRRQTVLRWQTLRYLAIMAGLAAVLILPFYVPLLSDLSASDRPAYLQETGWVRYSTDLLGFVALSPFTPWTQPMVPAYSWSVLGTNSIEGTAYLGIIAIVLAGIAFVRRRAQAGLWLVIGIGCMIFSLGPILKWMDQPVAYTLGEYQSNIVLPWALFQSLPLANATRTPGRFNITTGLALAVLAALGLEVVISRFVQRQRLQFAGAGILVVAILIEYQLFFPFLNIPAALPAYFSTLADRNDVRAVFDLPWDDPIAQKNALYEQTAHHKALIAGYISRRTPVDPAKLTLLSAAALGTPFEQGKLTSEAARAMLSSNGVDVLVYHWQLLDKGQVMAWATKTFGAPVYQDDQKAIFEVPRTTQLPQTASTAFAASGWWQSPTDATAWMTGESDLYIYNAVPVDRHWTLQVSPLFRSRQLRLSVDGKLERAWKIDTQATLDLWLSLESGFHTLRFILPDGCTAVPVQPVCLLTGATYSDQDCQLKDNQQSVCVGLALQQIQSEDSGALALQTANVQLSNGLSMTGFRAPSETKAGQLLTVETDWSATQKLPGDYHLFVHLLDQQGNPVAQYDAVPGNGTFPTTVWAMQQTWIETATLPLPATLPAGSYSLYTGWYRYPDLTRLGVTGTTPHAADGLVYLRDVQVR